MKSKLLKAAGKTGRKTIIKSLSLSKKVIEIGTARAKEARRSFSNHVSMLIEADASTTSRKS